MKISNVLDFLKEENISFAFTGNDTEEADGFSSLTRYKPGSFTWIKTKKHS